MRALPGRAPFADDGNEGSIHGLYSRHWGGARHDLFFQREMNSEAPPSSGMPRDDLPFCNCRWLEREAHDPNSPIEFDAELNEYHLKKADGYAMIYHCPFCAGRTPISLRDQMFATVTPDELHRLVELTKDIRTEEEMREKLGEPDKIFEIGGSCTSQEEEGKAPEIRTYKSARYDGFSETAEVNIKLDRYGKVHIAFSGKYIGKPCPP